MDEKQEQVGRQRLAALVAHEARLIELDTDRMILFPVGHSRHDGAEADYENHLSVVERLRSDPAIAAVRVADADAAVVAAQAALAAVEAETMVTVQAANEAIGADITSAARRATTLQDALRKAESDQTSRRAKAVDAVTLAQAARAALKPT